MKNTGLILVNLGSPNSYEVKDVRTYLRQFLMDERVIDAPYLIRTMIVEGFVLPFRPKKSAEAYLDWPPFSPTSKNGPANPPCGEPAGPCFSNFVVPRFAG